jgi:GTPase SAR1 family protein
MFLKKIEFPTENLSKEFNIKEVSFQISEKYEKTISPGQAEAVMRRVIGETPLSTKERSQLYDLRKKIYRYEKFLTSFREWGRKYDHQLKIIILGLTEEQSDYLPSILNKHGTGPERDIIGVSFFTKLTENYDKSLTSLSIWDISKKERFASIRPQFYKGVAGVLLVFNTEDRDSFEMIKKYFIELRESTDLKFKVRRKIKKEISLPLSLIGIGNKLLIPYDEILSLASEMGASYGQIETIGDERFQDILRALATIILFKLKE